MSVTSVTNNQLEVAQITIPQVNLFVHISDQFKIHSLTIIKISQENEAKELICQNSLSIISNYHTIQVQVLEVLTSSIFTWSRSIGIFHTYHPPMMSSRTTSDVTLDKLQGPFAKSTDLVLVLEPSLWSKIFRVAVHPRVLAQYHRRPHDERLGRNDVTPNDQVLRQDAA